MSADFWQMQQQLEYEQWLADKAGQEEYESWSKAIDHETTLRMEDKSTLTEEYIA